MRRKKKSLTPAGQLSAGESECNALLIPVRFIFRLCMVIIGAVVFPSDFFFNTDYIMLAF